MVIKQRDAPRLPAPAAQVAPCKRAGWDRAAGPASRCRANVQELNLCLQRCCPALLSPLGGVERCRGEVPAV